MIWDHGTLTDDEESNDIKASQSNLRKGLEKGDLKFRLNGKKLHGSFVLVKLKNAEDNAWLLIKHGDEWAMTEDITELDKSATTGRSMEDISKGEHQWVSTPKLNINKAPKSDQPNSIKPMLATATEQPFDDKDWIYEVKWDGYRILAYLKDGKVKLKSRNGQDYTEIFASIADELSNLKTDCILDGEMVVVDDRGRSNFGGIQNYQKTKKGDLRYYIFDVPYADGRDLKSNTLVERKEIALRLIQHLDKVSLSDHIWERGKDFFEIAADQELEGIIAKNSNSKYETGKRSKSWLKVKTKLRQEAVIGGFTKPKNGRKYLGSLILGVYDKKGRLQPVGSSGGGFTDKELKELYELLSPLTIDECPFDEKPQTLGTPVWVKPKFMAEISFSEWTSDGQMRHPVYLGLRSDKPVRDVFKESKASKVELTNQKKIFFPEDKITKGDLIEYYDSVSDYILPHLKDRPESLNRHPNGIHGKSFYHKDIENHPDWVKTHPIFSEHNQKDINWLVANDKDHLLYMINLGSIELHPWHSRLGSLDNPDYCLIDLDAKDSSFEKVIEVALATHEVLEELGIPSFVKTSGKTGMHVLIPLGTKYDYEQSKMFAQLITQIVHGREPKITSIERTPSKRKKGTVYLDYLQNRKGQTMAAAYCVRPIPGAPVSTPLDWSEVKKGLKPKNFNIKNILKRLEGKGDLHADLLNQTIDLEKILKRIEQI